MCGRFVLNTDLGRILEGFHAVLREPHEYSPRFNIAPTQQIPVLVSDPTGSRSLQWMRWGLLPSWARDSSLASRLINARAESAADKPSFRNPFANRRCAIPASGFYEWKAGRRGKIPHLIEVRDQPIFAMAGLWDRWEVRAESGKKTGEVLETFTILTVDASEQLRALHDRMPRILSQPELDEWMNPKSDPEELRKWIALTPGDLQFVNRPVSRDVNSPRNDFPELLEAPPETDLFGDPVED